MNLYILSLMNNTEYNKSRPSFSA